jgi:hypothetical protein
MGRVDLLVRVLHPESCAQSFNPGLCLEKTNTIELECDYKPNTTKVYHWMDPNRFSMVLI